MTEKGKKEIGWKSQIGKKGLQQKKAFIYLFLFLQE